jgi:hypothetical protein
MVRGVGSEAEVAGAVEDMGSDDALGVVEERGSEVVGSIGVAAARTGNRTTKIENATFSFIGVRYESDKS